MLLYRNHNLYHVRRGHRNLLVIKHFDTYKYRPTLSPLLLPPHHFYLFYVNLKCRAKLYPCKHNYRADNSCINFHWLWSFMLESWKDWRFWFPIIFSFETKANFMSHVEHISDWGEENWNYEPVTPPCSGLSSQTSQVVNSSVWL